MRVEVLQVVRVTVSGLDGDYFADEKYCHVGRGRSRRELPVQWARREGDDVLVEVACQAGKLPAIGDAFRFGLFPVTGQIANVVIP